MRIYGISFFLLCACLALGLLQLTSTGCSSRVETAVAQADSTLTYPAKDPGGLEAKITLCRKISKRTGKPLGAGTVFTTRPKAKVRALIELENPLALGERDLQLHVVWLGPNQKRFYKKMIDYTPDPASPFIKGSISIPPDRRLPGRYTCQVYLFRELIAEKHFYLQAATE